MARKGRGRQKQGHVVDMSLPADERHRAKTTRTSRTPVPAQLQHALSPAGRRKARDGERWLDTERPQDDTWGRADLSPGPSDAAGRT